MISEENLMPEDYKMFYSNEEIDLAKNRASVCLKCCNLSKKDFNCIKCSCDFKSKLFNKSKQCPIKKW